MFFERFNVSRLFVDGDQSSHCGSPSVVDIPMTKRRQETDRGFRKVFKNASERVGARVPVDREHPIQLILNADSGRS
jgi:hypothetical protein